MELRLSDIILYYEKTGSGKPLILLHGNGEDHTVFDVLVSELNAHFTVYAIDSRGHGLSSPQNEFHYDVMADDVAAFIDALKLEQPAVYGFSDGGIIGLILAYKYPSYLSSLVISGANITPNGLKWCTRRAFIKEFRKEHHPLIQLMLHEPNITVDNLSKITVPTLVLAGEHDLIRERHTRMIAKHIKNATLKIIPGEDHSSYVVDSVKLLSYLTNFCK